MFQMRKIAFEEHFMAPSFEAYSSVFMQHLRTKESDELAARLADVGEMRLEAMDAAGISYMVLSQTGPSVQGEPNLSLAVRRATENNDVLAKRIASHPDRFGGFATLPMGSPKAAAEELSRAVDELGFHGALVHGHTFGRYYDEPEFDIVWERFQSLDVPLYLHPVDFHEVPAMFRDCPVLHRATWGWGVETGTHALRLLFGGVFDRFPGLKLVLGHMGEGLPFYRWRFDSRFAAYPHGMTLKRKPSEYIGRNILVTTTGVCSAAVLSCVVEEMGSDAVMFSVDYPYESTTVAADFIDQAPLSAEIREKICFGNAERLLKLNAPAAFAHGFA